MKKCLIICLLVLSIVSMMLPVGAASDIAVFDIRLPSEMPETGETFEVAVELSNNPGFCAIEFTLSYDTAVMECVDVITDGALAGALSATNPKAENGAVVAAASLKILEGDGPIAIYTFRTSENITAFDFGLKNIVLVDENNTDIEYEIAGSNEADNTPSLPDDSAANEEEVIDKPEDVFTDNTGSNDTVTDEPGSGSEGEEEAPEQSFPDVVGHWAELFVDEAVKHGLFMGDTEGNFNPDDNVTRAQFVTVLWRLAGRPNVDVETPFTDTETQVPEFKAAIAWGYANGYIKGTSDTTFEPGATLTREAGMKILHLYSGGASGKEIQLYGVYDGTFEDSSEISGWAKDSVYWGVYNKLISGTSSTMLSPKGTATRAQLAKILVSYLNIN